MKALLITLAVFVGVGIFVTAPGVVMLALTVLFGWAPAARRLLYDAPFTAWDLALFASGCVVFVLGLHWFLTWLRSWRARWTLALTGTVGLVLLAIMSVVGTAHQLGWLLLSHEPLFAERRGNHIRERRDLENTARVLADIADTNLRADRASAILADSRLPDSHDGKRPWEKYHVVMMEPTNTHLFLIWHRDDRIHQRVGSASVTLEGVVTMQPSDYLRALIGNAQGYAAQNY